MGMYNTDEVNFLLSAFILLLTVDIFDHVQASARTALLFDYYFVSLCCEEIAPDISAICLLQNSCFLEVIICLHKVNCFVFELEALFKSETGVTWKGGGVH